jgi:peptidyl-prolyl cis-trans isomerase SurA
MFRRSFVSFSFAAAVTALSYGQIATPPAAPSSSAQALASTVDSLNLRFSNGIVAVVEDKIITVADVMREIIPLRQQIQAEARSQKDYEQRMEQLEDSVIQDLVDRVLIIKDFYKDEKRHIPPSYVDNAISDRVAEQFDNDRAKFLAYLRAQGKTNRDYRKDVEEEIIYSYMRGQQRKSESIVSPVRIETYYRENRDKFYQEDQVHLRLIQLTRNEGDTDESLRQQANLILARLKAGEKFEDLAKEFSRDARRSKGGDWGLLKRSDFRPEFSEKAFALKKGEVSDPILLPEGCFLLYVEDRKFAGIQPIDEVRDQIERILVTQMSRTNQERWLERLRRNGYVKYY